MLLLNKVVNKESSKREIKKQTTDYKDEMERGPIMSRELAWKTTAQIWAGRWGVWERVGTDQTCMHAKSLWSCPTLYDPMDYSLPSSSVHGDSPGKNTGVGCHDLLQGIFQAQELNPCVLCLLDWQMGSLPLAPPGKPLINPHANQVYNQMHLTLWRIVCMCVSVQGGV